MTIAFIIAAIIAGILFFLYLDGREKFQESILTIQDLKSQIRLIRNETAPSTCIEQTVLTRELVSEAIVISIRS